MIQTIESGIPGFDQLTVSELADGRNPREIYDINIRTSENRQINILQPIYISSTFKTRTLPICNY